MSNPSQDKIPTEGFLEAVRLTPMVAIDLIVRNPRGEVLLGLRNNEPAANTWFVPGGRILKDERLDTAFERIARVELGISVSRSQARFLGPYEHLYDTNFARAPGVSTHYVVLAHEITTSEPIASPADDQHGELRWWPVRELLDSPDVHANTKAYFPARAG